MQRTIWTLKSQVTKATTGIKKQATTHQAIGLGVDRCSKAVEDKVQAVIVTRRLRSEQRLTNIDFGA